MVRSLNGLGYELSELYRGTYKVTDSIDIRLFKTWIQQVRATLSKQRIDEPMSIIDEHMLQSLQPVTFAPVDSSIDINIPSGKYLMKSTLPLPTTINRKGNLATFTRIAPADMLEKAFNFVTYNRALTSGSGKFNQNDIYVFLSNQYLYLLSRTNIHKYITKVHVKGLFVNPQDAYEFGGGRTWNDDMEYPISEAIVMDMQSIIMEKKFKYIMTPFEDNKANGVDDIVNPTNKK